MVTRSATTKVTTLLQIIEKRMQAKMYIPWRFKSFLFQVIENFELHSVLYWAQKRITRRAPRSFQQVSPNWRFHEVNIQSWRKLSITRVFEFGAGRSLAQNLFLSRTVSEQYLVDLNPMLNMGLCESARNRLVELGEIRAGDSLAVIEDLKSYGISYEAPCNAADTNEPASSFTGFVSTNTFEHLPKKDIPIILKELYRILAPGGLLSIIIDYSDHYSSTDRTISDLNFLRFEEDVWSRFNHSSHYQNRLRHYDYLTMFQNAGFGLIASDLELSENPVPAKIEKKFEHAPDSWRAVKGFWVLEKPEGD